METLGDIWSASHPSEGSDWERHHCYINLEGACHIRTYPKTFIMINPTNRPVLIFDQLNIQGYKYPKNRAILLGSEYMSQDVTLPEVITIHDIQFPLVIKGLYAAGRNTKFFILTIGNEQCPLEKVLVDAQMTIPNHLGPYLFFFDVNLMIISEDGVA